MQRKKALVIMQGFSFGMFFLVAAEEIFYCDNDDVTIGGMV